MTVLKKFISLTCCLLFISQFSVAQSDTLQWNPGVKLKFSDFYIDRSTTHVFTDIIVQYDYTLQPIKFGKFRPIIHTRVILNRNTATLPDSNKNALRYAQLLFDLSAYESRLIKLKVFELGELNERVSPAKASMENAFLQANNEVSRLKKNMTEQLSGLENEQVFTEWEAKVASLLQNTPEIVEERSLGKLQLGVFIGAT